MQQTNNAIKSQLDEIVQSSPNPKANRFLAFDFARGIAIIAMVAIHSIVFIGSSELPTSNAGLACNFIISLLAAPVFMFVMGILFCNSSRSSLKTQLFRGVVLLTIGYILNLFRGTLPIAVGKMLGWFADADSDVGSAWSYLLEDDILQFAGLAIIFLALLKRIIPWKFGWFILCLVILFISPYLWNKGSDQPIINYIISLFTGSEEYNYFPFFPWIAFPLAGMIYGDFLKHAKDKDNFFKINFIVGLVILLSGVFLTSISNDNLLQMWLNGNFRQGKLPAEIIILFIGFQLIWLSACNFMTSKLPDNRFINSIYFWSKNVTSFYVVQWILIGWICVMIPTLEWIPIIFCISLVVYFTDRVVHLYNRNFKS